MVIAARVDLYKTILSASFALVVRRRMAAPVPAELRAPLVQLENRTTGGADPAGEKGIELESPVDGKLVGSAQGIVDADSPVLLEWACLN